MPSRTAALAACLLAVAGCSGRDESDDPILRADAASDPFATVEADAPPTGPDAGITSELPVDPRDDAVPGADDSVPGIEGPRDDDVRVADGVAGGSAGEFAGPYFAPVPVPGDRYGNGGGRVGAAGSTFGVAGLYDASIGRPLGTDVRYVYITPDGVLIVYDYDLDPYGTGLNCYRDGRPQSLLRDPGRDRADDYLVDGRSVRIARETLGIGYGFTDTLDDDRDGDITEFLYYRYPRISGLSVIDFDRCR